MAAKNSLLDRLKAKQNPQDTPEKPQKKSSEQSPEGKPSKLQQKAASESPKPAKKHTHKHLKSGQKCPDCGVIHRCKHGPKQDTRMHKVSCPDCDWIIRMSRRAMNIGLPDCPSCGRRTVSHLPKPIPF